MWDDFIEAWDDIKKAAEQEKQKEEEVVLYKDKRFIEEKLCYLKNAYDATTVCHVTRVGNCSNCGEVIEVEHKYCFECGARQVSKEEFDNR